MTVHQPRILLVDDDPLARAAHELMLRQLAEVVTAVDGADALATICWGAPFDLVICDVDMPRLDGPAFFRLLQKGWPTLATQLVFLTGSSSAARERELRALGRPVFRKPIAPEDLHALARLWLGARLAG